LDAADKPFVSLVNATVQLTLPPLPSPGDMQAAPELSKVRDLLWDRIASASSDLKVDQAHEKETISTLNTMCSLREWLLRQPAYSNLALTFKIDRIASRALLVGLSNGSMTTKDGAKIMEALNKGMSREMLLAVAESDAPQSNVLKNYLTGTRSLSLYDLADKLADEQGGKDIFFSDPNDLIKQVNVAEFLVNGVDVVITTFTTKLLVAYVSEGGNLNVGEAELMQNFDKKFPDSFVGTEPITNSQISTLTLLNLIRGANAWQTNRSL
jgi:hypothetical protein